MNDERVAAAFRLEAEIERLLGGFAVEHAALIRQACQLGDDVVDIAPVVVTTLYGHTLVALGKLHGRAHVERMTQVLLDAEEAVAKAKAEAKEGAFSVSVPVDEAVPPRELRH